MFVFVCTRDHQFINPVNKICLFSFSNQNVNTEISFFKPHAICLKWTHYDIDSLNITVFVYGFDNTTHSENCTEPLLNPTDSAEEDNYTSDEEFCNYVNSSSYRRVDYLDFGLNNGDLVDNLFDNRTNNQTSIARPILLAADAHVINLILCCSVFYLLSYFVNARQLIIIVI